MLVLLAIIVFVDLLPWTVSAQGDACAKLPYMCKRIYIATIYIRIPTQTIDQELM